MRTLGSLLAVMAFTLSLGARADTMFTSTGFSGYGDPNTQVMIVDLTPNLSLALGGDPVIPNPISNLVISGETLSFDYTMPGTGNFGGTCCIDVYRDLLDPNTNAVSDIFRLQTNGGATAHISFGSDTSMNLTGSTHLVDLNSNFPDLVETGTFQTMVSFCPQEGCGASGVNGDVSVEFQVQSDLPEGSNVAWLGFGFVGLGFMSRRRWLETSE